MAGSQDREARVRFLEGTPELRAAVQEVFTHTENGEGDCIGVMAVFVPKGAGPAQREQARQRLREVCHQQENLAEIRAQIERLRQQETVGRVQTAELRHFTPALPPIEAERVRAARAITVGAATSPSMEEMLVAIRAEIAALRAERGELAGTVARIEQKVETARGEQQRGHEDLRRSLEAVARNQNELRRENEELREAKAALAEMHGEGLLTFVHKLDAEAFKLVIAVLVQGDVAKAARALSMEVESVRWQLRSWRTRGGVYGGLVELIKWRKGKRMAGACQYNDALAKVSAGTDRESVLSEVLSGLRSMTDGNWQDVRAELKVELLKLTS